MEGDTNVNDNLTCKQSFCIEDGDQYKVECKDCQRLVHYKRTQLPLYQLQLFLTTGYRKFVCINCVDIPKYLEDMVPAQSPSQTKTMAELTIALKETSKEIDNHKVANQALANTNLHLRTQLETHIEEIAQLQDDNKEHEKSVDSYESKINEQHQEIVAQQEKFNQARNPDYESVLKLENR